MLTVTFKGMFFRITEATAYLAFAFFHKVLNSLWLETSTLSFWCVWQKELSDTCFWDHFHLDFNQGISKWQPLCLLQFQSARGCLADSSFHMCQQGSTITVQPLKEVAWHPLEEFFCITELLKKTSVHVKTEHLCLNQSPSERRLKVCYFEVAVSRSAVTSSGRVFAS